MKQGKWDETITPSFSSENNGKWEFTYDNGEDDCGNPQRTWVPTFQCEEGTEWREDQAAETGTCRYEATIYTKYACLGHDYCQGGGGGGGNGDNDNDGLSGGWIFIICLIGGFFLYFLIGYSIKATTVNKDGGFGDFNNNIPQKEFWIVCPKLVMTGCQVSKEYVMALINKGKGGGGEGMDEALATDQ